MQEWWDCKKNKKIFKFLSPLLAQKQRFVYSTMLGSGGRGNLEDTVRNIHTNKQTAFQRSNG